LATQRELWNAAAGSAAPCRGEGGVAVAGVKTHQGRRSRVAGGRRFPVQCLFDDAEIATIREAAVGEGVSVGAWCSSVSLRAAREQVQPLDADWRLVMRELMALRRQARTIGGLLNQVAAASNATGELAAQAGRVLGMVERIVADVDVVTARARARLR
jgi:hypothetical protein